MNLKTILFKNIFLDPLVGNTFFWLILLRSLDDFIHWNLAFALAKLHVNVDITIWFFVG